MVWRKLDTTMPCIYHSVPGKRPFPGKRPCAEFQGVTVAASIQTYGIYIPGKRPYGLKSQVMFTCLSAHGRLPGTLRYIHKVFSLESFLLYGIMYRVPAGP